MNPHRFFVGRVIGLLVVLAVVGVGYLVTRQSTVPPAATFEECVAAGNPVMESYPRQCNTKDGKHFVENIGNELEKADLIRISTPRPNQTISSPLVITGEARGNWFFEASFPIVLTDWNGKIVAQGIAQAQGDWMTTDFVPFKATLTFTTDKNIYSNKGSLILKKDNPSGLSQNDDALEIPVVFATVTATSPTTPPVSCTMDAKLCSDGSSVGRTGPNCEFAKCPISTSNGISIGAKTTINGTSIGVIELVEDSRCPVDVQCIQAGTVRVRASIDSYNNDFTFTLLQPQVVGNVTITLASVIPLQKYSTQTVKQSDYRFTFTVAPFTGPTPNNPKY